MSFVKLWLPHLHCVTSWALLPPSAWDEKCKACQSFKFNLTFFFIRFLFRPGSNFLQQPQCFQTWVVLRLDHGTSRTSPTAIPCDIIYEFLSLIYFNIWSQRENVEGVSQPPNDDVIRELSRSLRQALGVSLFGIDVIINNQTGQHAVIDINAFPGRCSLSYVCVLFYFICTLSR